MGLSIAISGGITASALVIILGIIFAISYQINTESLANTESFEIDNAFSKTKLNITSIEAESGNNVINFNFSNIGSEKLWNYDDFDVLITYDANIGGVLQTITEEFSYNATAALQELDPIIPPVGPIQFGRPISTIANTFTIIGAPTAHQAVDEIIPNGNTDYLSGTVNTDTATVGLNSLTDPQTSTGHILRFNAISVQPAVGPPETLNINLYEGGTFIGGSPSIQITRGSYNTYTYTLTNPEANAITDYSILRIQINLVAIGPPPPGAEEVRITQTEFEIPPVPAAPGNLVIIDGLDPNEWTINRIVTNTFDPGIVNTQEEAQIVTTLSYPIFTNGLVTISINSDNGKEDIDSITAT